VIKAAIFDMDGLLINSEPFWRKAEVFVFKPLGLQIDEEDCIETMGLRIDVAVKYWFDKFNYKDADIYVTADNVVKKVKEFILREGNLMPGVLDTLIKLKERNIPMAIASSSSIDLFKAVTKKCKIENFFNSICSAENEEYGKPHPAVYLQAAKKLGVNPENCLVFEDSLSGVISAKAALMKVVAVPSKAVAGEAGFVIADKILFSLKDFNLEIIENFNDYRS
jgi:sugar-phosphatase